MGKIVKVALGYPWYAGADRDCVTPFLANAHYFGRLQERLWWLNNSLEAQYEDAPPLDKYTSGRSEIPPELIGTGFEFFIASEVGCSLPGLAREHIVDKCLAAGMDYILWSDADMIWGTDVFLRLYMDQKPIVGALAFTGRKPVVPVIFAFKNYGTFVDGHGETHINFDAQPVLDYQRDALQKVDAIGSGVMLIDCQVFKQIPKPWFTSYGLGEDIWFCSRAKAYGVEVWVDTRAKTQHKPTFHDVWHNEETFIAQGPLTLTEPEPVPA